MGNETDRPHIPPPPPAVAHGSSMPNEATDPRYGDDGVQERRGRWTRLKTWFAREPVRHDTYVSSVTNLDDRPLIPRR